MVAPSYWVCCWPFSGVYGAPPLSQSMPHSVPAFSALWVLFANICYSPTHLGPILPCPFAPSLRPSAPLPPKTIPRAQFSVIEVSLECVHSGKAKPAVDRAAASIWLWPHKLKKESRMYYRLVRRNLWLCEILILKYFDALLFKFDKGLVFPAWSLYKVLLWYIWYSDTLMYLRIDICRHNLSIYNIVNSLIEDVHIFNL